MTSPFGRSLAAVLAQWALAAAVESPCKSGGLYDDWISKPDAFIRMDQPKGLQGLHVACVWRGGDGGIMLEAYKDALEVSNPEVHTLGTSADASWAAFRKAVQKALKVKKDTNNWGKSEFKQVFGVFAAFGNRLLSVDSALDAKLIFVIVGGQWFWPPVRDGFLRALPGLDMQLETLSVQPVVYQVRGFLKGQECDEIVRLGANRMESSPVSLMDKDKGKGSKEFRTSSQARVSRSESNVLRDIDARVGNLTGVPKLHNEEVQILSYQKTQYYSAHLDNWDPQFYSDSAWFEHGHNNRMITVFWYLTTVDKGGETLFPRAHGLPQPQDMWSCERGLKVKPVKGTVIFWYSLHPNGNTDPNGLHAACPVEEGEKWSANYWVWNKPKIANPGDRFAEQMAAAATRETPGRELREVVDADSSGWGSSRVVTTLIGVLLAAAVFKGAPVLLGKGSGEKTGKSGRAERKEAKKKR